MTKDEALDLALEALENSIVSPAMFATWGKYQEAREHKEKALTAIKQARSASVQEPVAWGCNRYIEDDNGFQIGTDEPELAWGKYAPDDNGWWPLYTTPPATQPAFVQEPVAQWQKKHATLTEGEWMNSNHGDANWWLENGTGWEIRALYTTQPAGEKK